MSNGVPWDAVISAVSGLVGVAVGGWITSRSQAQERTERRYREQVDEFYGPLVGMRALLQAKGKARMDVMDALHDAWRELCAPFEGKPDALNRIVREREGEYKRAMDYYNRQLREELIPEYKRMLEHFVSRISLAEASTRDHLPELVRYVEGWRDDLPPEVLEKVGANESRLQPFYDELDAKLVDLQRKIAEKTG